MLQKSNLKFVVVLALSLFINIAVASSQTFNPDSVEWVDLDFMDTVDPDEFDILDLEPETESVFMIVETQPEYPGGADALKQFVSENVRYPKELMQRGITGRVLVSFVINKDGSVVEPEIVKSAHPLMDAEGLRLVSIMPKWKPGTQRGQPVRVKYTMPVNFRLDGKVEDASYTEFDGELFSAEQINQAGDEIIGVNFHLGAKSNSKKNWDNVPDVVSDPADENNKCIMVSTKGNPKSEYDSQLFIVLDEKLEAGDIVTLTMKVKASKSQSSKTEAQTSPGYGDYNFLGYLGDMDFAKEWQRYTTVFRVNSDSFRTIAVDLSVRNKENDCYFDDIRLTVEKGAGNNGNTQANSQPAFKSAFDKGMDYLLGSKEQIQDFQQAYDNFSIAAQEGNADAICMIGYMYEKGYSVTQDYGMAVDWYKKAAEMNHAGAQNSLGRMYANGYGVEKDKEQALSWYRKAAANGNKQAKNSIAQLESETASKTIALIIGNADYPQGRLANPVNDAQDLAVKLKGLGFDVIGKTNLDLADMNQAIDDFCKRATDYDAAMFFYAGHAVQNGGVNYLMPAKSAIDAAAINDACVNMNQVMAKLDASDVKTKIIILDACRDNGLQSLSRSASEQGLARMSSSGSIIMFSTQAGKTAKDGTGNRNSPFTQELLKEIDRPNVPLHQIFKDIQTNVSNNTNKEQVPSINDDLIGTFYFNVKY